MSIQSHQVEGKRFTLEIVECGGCLHAPPRCASLLLECGDCGATARVKRGDFDGSHVCAKCGGGDFVAIHGRRR